MARPIHEVVGIAVAAWLVFVTSACEKPNQYDPNTDPARIDAGGSTGGAGGGGGAAGGGGPDGPAAADGPGTGGCQPGTHLCSGTCVEDNLPTSCGGSCTPCPVVAGGTSTCVAGQCGGSCPSGKKLCLTECVAADAPCDQNCAAGSHKCVDLCVLNTHVNSCGAACTGCPVPAGATATCDGTGCGFTCDQGKKCGEGKDGRCGDCCAAGDCAAQPGRTASCDQATLKCKYGCPEGMKDCNGTCIAAAGCCTDADCPMMASQGDKVGKCDSSTRQCTYTCSGDTVPCGGRCIARGGCCDDAGCTGNFACVNNSCSGSQCRANYKRCGSDCIPMATCCRADGCCAHSDCPMCKKCVSGACVNQGTNEDVKEECGEGTCRTGRCNGNGACGNTASGQKGTDCQGDCQQCNGSGVCGALSDGQTCGSGRRCSSGQCMTCGALNQDCCPGGTPCGAGTRCDAGKCVTACGSGEKLCPGTTRCIPVAQCCSLKCSGGFKCLGDPDPSRDRCSTTDCDESGFWTCPTETPRCKAKTRFVCGLENLAGMDVCQVYHWEVNEGLTKFENGANVSTVCRSACAALRSVPGFGCSEGTYTMGCFGHEVEDGGRGGTARVAAFVEACP
jgi:hypothetical protein